MKLMIRGEVPDHLKAQIYCRLGPKSYLEDVLKRTKGDLVSKPGCVMDESGDFE